LGGRDQKGEAGPCLPFGGGRQGARTGGFVLLHRTIDEVLLACANCEQKIKKRNLSSTLFPESGA
jgi:hypothetical protein